MEYPTSQGLSEPTRDPARIRLVPELRAVHRDRHQSFLPATLLFFDYKYDLLAPAHPSSLHPSSVRQVTCRSALREFWRSSATVLEMPEPLWIRFLPRHVLLAAGFLLSRRLRGQRGRICCYAMENNTMARLLGGDHRVARPVVVVASALLGAYIRLVVSRIAFASSGSRDLYKNLPFVSRVEHSMRLELPAPNVAAPKSPSDRRVVFVGVLEERKGVPELLRAWEHVEGHDDAHLVVVGPGHLSPRVAEWAAARPKSRSYVGPLDHDQVRSVIAGARVLVAPSVPAGRWREQIGLPIKEALAEGVSVVTTTETGLADWLEQNGHGVVNVRPRSDIAPEVAAQILRLLESPLSRTGVRQSLPLVDARQAADAWLHREFDSEWPV